MLWGAPARHFHAVRSDQAALTACRLSYDHEHEIEILMLCPWESIAHSTVYFHVFMLATVIFVLRNEKPLMLLKVCEFFTCTNLFPFIR